MPLYVLGSFGNADRLMIVFDESRLTLLDVREMFQVGEYRLNDWNHRPPLVVHLKDKSNGVEFYLVTVHLARKNAKLRMEQALGLQEWARDLEQPAIAIGDFNFDLNFNTGETKTISGVPGRGDVKLSTFDFNESGDAFIAVEDNPWTWISPVELIDTNWSDSNRDGVDDYPDSALDFSFVHIPPGSAKARTKASVIVRDGDFPDNKATSDHRPITLWLDWVKVPNVGGN